MEKKIMGGGEDLALDILAQQTIVTICFLRLGSLVPPWILPASSARILLDSSLDDPLRPARLSFRIWSPKGQGSESSKRPLFLIRQ